MSDGINTDIEKLYKEIADDLISNSKRCVLILGPEILTAPDGKGYKTCFKELERDESLGIETYYETDNLFSFSDGSGSGRTRDAINQFYRNAGDPVLLEMIARLKFPLIINLCPDNSLGDIYSKKGIDYLPGHFTYPKNNIFESELKPSRQTPVVFNVFGTIDRPETLIYTHSELYRRIEELLPKDSLPSMIESYLDLANSFVFLGVKFDSWYYQLICHKLGLSKTGAKKKLGTEFRVPGDEKREDKNISAATENVAAKQVSRKQKKGSMNAVVSKSFGLVFTNENPATVVEKLISFCGDNKAALRDMGDISSYSLFVSYSWRDKDKSEAEVTRQTPVDYLQSHHLLKAETQLQFLRDKTTVDFGDNIQSFMTRIGKGKTVFRVISDRYLTSYFCMKESLLMEQYKDEGKRVYTILWDDVETGNISRYRDFWLKKLETIADNADDERSDDYPRIYRFIGPFFNKIVNENNPVFGAADFVIDPVSKLISMKEGEKKEVMEKITGAIISKLKEK